MIHYTTGDILRDEADAIVNTVYCVGVMGRGIALQFKNAFPENFKAYKKACNNNEVQPGRMFVTDRFASVDGINTRVVAEYIEMTRFPVPTEDFYQQTSPRYGAEANMLLYNGPFKLTRWIHGAHVRMEKNDLYWNAERVQINVLDFPYITTDTNAALNLFKDNKIAYTGLAAENLNEAMERDWHIQRFMDGSVFFLEFNYRPGRATGSSGAGSRS